MFFKVTARDSQTKARTGVITARHGKIRTPCFAPDATYGTVKHISAVELKKIPLQLVLGNIYHLWLRPGIPLIKKMGGLNNFMNWDKPIITDSGGFQVFSLVHRRKMGEIRENGIVFKDHLTGKKHFLTPKKSIQMQLDAGADILMALDYPIEASSSPEENEKSVTLTAKWAKICQQYFANQPAAKGKILMAIIQGSSSKKMRRLNYEQLAKLDFPGYGFGGPPSNKEVVAYTASLIPDDKIRYVMGGATPSEILDFVSMGWDFFDCVIPTRNGRHGLAYTFNGEIKLKQEKYRFDQKSPDPACHCLTCKNHSRSYLRHLFKVKEPLAERLISLHNLYFYEKLMREIRKAIRKKEFAAFRKKLIGCWKNPAIK